MTSLALRCALLLSRYHWQRWEAYTDNPRATQSELLLQILGKNQATAFGRDHGFGAIKTIADYRKQVSIADYERFRPYIERARQGEKAVGRGYLELTGYWRPLRL